MVVYSSGNVLFQTRLGRGLNIQSTHIHHPQRCLSSNWGANLWNWCPDYLSEKCSRTSKVMFVLSNTVLWDYPEPVIPHPATHSPKTLSWRNWIGCGFSKALCCKVDTPPEVHERLKAPGETGNRNYTERKASAGDRSLWGDPQSDTSSTFQHGSVMS